MFLLSYVVEYWYFWAERWAIKGTPAFFLGLTTQSWSMYVLNICMWGFSSRLFYYNVSSILYSIHNVILQYVVYLVGFSY